jgi:hypothetical protein
MNVKMVVHEAQERGCIGADEPVRGPAWRASPRLAAAVAFQVVQDGLDRSLEGNQVVGHDLPDAPVLHMGIVVTEHVAEVGDAAPGYSALASRGT